MGTSTSRRSSVGAVAEDAPVAEDTAVVPHTVEETAGSATGRGRTTIADKVIERIAARAALEVPAVVRHNTGPEMLSAVTSNLPRVSAETAGDRLGVELTVALDWAASAHEAAADVRRHVGEQLERLTGKTVDRVDVTVAALVTGSAAGRERRVE